MIIYCNITTHDGQEYFYNPGVHAENTQSTYYYYESVRVQTCAEAKPLVESRKGKQLTRISLC